MAIQSPERAEEVINTWFSRHPELVNDSHNAETLGVWIKSNHSVAGELVLTDASLEIAFQTLAGSGQLHFYASQETQNQIAQANRQALDAQTKLAEEQAAKAREDEKLHRELERQLRQDARRAGPSSAFGNRDERAAEVAKAHKAIRDQAERNALHAQFQKELAAANQILITINAGGFVKWGATNEARANAKKALAQKYYMFKSEL